MVTTASGVTLTGPQERCVRALGDGPRVLSGAALRTARVLEARGFVTVSGLLGGPMRASLTGAGEAVLRELP